MRRILVVEDDAVLLRLTCDVLQDEGFTVLAAATTADALCYLASGELQLVVMDLSLGTDGDGALAARVAELGLPILVISGAMEIEVRARDLNAAGVLQKPFELDDFTGLVKALAGTRCTQTAARSASPGHAAGSPPADTAHIQARQ